MAKIALVGNTNAIKSKSLGAYVMKFRLPFQRLDYVNGLEDAQVEAQFGQDMVHTTKALHWNISATIWMLTGFALLIMNYALPSAVVIPTVVVPHNLNESLALMATWFFNINWSRVVAELLVVALFGYIGPYLADTFVRAVVYTLGFTVSLDPGRIVRNYVYTRDLKILMAIMGGFLSLVYFVFWFGGVLGWILFVWPTATINWSNPILWGLMTLWALVQWIGFVWWPASRIRVQDHAELFEAMILVEAVQIAKTRIQFKKRLVEIAMPHLAVQLVADVRERGPIALEDWTGVSAKFYGDVARAIGESRSAIAEVRQKEISGKPFVAIQRRDGTQRVSLAPKVYPEIEAVAQPIKELPAPS